MYKRDELLIARGQPGAYAAKALEGAEAGRIGGYLIAFAGPDRRDLQGEYFDQQTDLLKDSYPIKGERVLYHHGMDRTLGVKRLGKIDQVRQDDVGIWVETQLDLSDRYQARIFALVQSGKLGWSSGALPQSVRVEKGGHIAQWGVIEASLTPAPAQPFLTAISPIKSIAQADAKSIFEDEGGTMNPALEMALSFVQQMAAAQGRTMSEEEKNTAAQAVLTAMGIDGAEGATEMQAMLNDEAKATALVGHVAKAVADADRTHSLFAAATQKAMTNGRPASKAAAVTGNGDSGHVTARRQPEITGMRDMKYDRASAQDLVFAAHWLGAAKSTVSETLLRAAHDKIERLLPYDNNAFGKEASAMKAAMPMKADELVATNLSGNGGNWVGTAYWTQLWEAARQPVIYQELIKAGMLEIDVPQGMQSIYMPAEGTDPIVYTLTEQNDVTADEFLPITAKATPSISPARRQLTPAFVGSRVAFSDIMEEDSLIPILPFLRQRMELAMQEAIEFMLINGDVTTTALTNINLIDGTPSVDTKGRGPRYLAFDGLLKLPLVTTTTLSRDGTTFNDDDYLETYKLLPTNEINESRLVFIVDVRTGVATRGLTNVKTRNLFENATLEGGKIIELYGIRYLVSNQMGLANATGKVSATASNNSKGRILCVRPDQWAIGYKREVKTEVARDIDSQSTVVVSTLRIGLQSQKATGGAAVTYNLTI